MYVYACMYVCMDACAKNEYRQTNLRSENKEGITAQENADYCWKTTCKVLNAKNKQFRFRIRR